MQAHDTQKIHGVAINPGLPVHPSKSQRPGAKGVRRKKASLASGFGAYVTIDRPGYVQVRLLVFVVIDRDHASSTSNMDSNRMSSMMQTWEASWFLWEDAIGTCRFYCLGILQDLLPVGCHSNTVDEIHLAPFHQPNNAIKMAIILFKTIQAVGALNNLIIEA